MPDKKKDHGDPKEPVIGDKHRIDPKAGKPAAPDASAPDSPAAEQSAAGEGRGAPGAGSARGTAPRTVYDIGEPDIEPEGQSEVRNAGQTPDADPAPVSDESGDESGDHDTPIRDAPGGDVPNDDTAGDDGAGDDGADDSPSDDALSAHDQRVLDEASRDLVSDMRDQMLRAQAELVNFRTRVERDRVANREAVIADVIRSMLPALDDLDRADKHGDIIEGTPLALVAQKINSSFERFGLRKIGEKGDLFDPAFHEAVVHLNDADASANTIADVFEPGYILGERVVRAAKVAVSGPAE